MDNVKKYREIIKKVLPELAALPRRNMQSETIFDDATNRYLLMVQGWQGVKRVHYCAAHLEIINGKIWIQRDGTEEGLAKELERNGVSKQEIVLGFHEPEARPFTEYAPA